MSTAPADTESPAAGDEATVASMSDSRRAVTALAGVERELDSLREQRHRLDAVEARMWQRRNMLESYLIGTLGVDWWHERRAQRANGTAQRNGAHEESA
jgi:hypothetical protein